MRPAWVCTGNRGYTVLVPIAKSPSQLGLAILFCFVSFFTCTDSQRFPECFCANVSDVDIRVGKTQNVCTTLFANIFVVNESVYHGLTHVFCLKLE